MNINNISNNDLSYIFEKYSPYIVLKGIAYENSNPSQKIIRKTIITAGGIYIRDFNGQTYSLGNTGFIDTDL